MKKIRLLGLDKTYRQWLTLIAILWAAAPSTSWHISVMCITLK